MRWTDAARVGITVVLAAALWLGITLATRGVFPLVQPSRTLRVAFDNVQGIQPRAPVMLRGVKVGEVQDIDLTGRQAVLTLKIENRDLPPRARFRIASSLFGFSSPSVEIVPAPEGEVIPPAVASEVTTLHGESGPGMEAMMPKADQLIDNVNRLALQMSDLTKNLNRVAADPRMQQNLLRITQNLALGSHNLETMSRSGPMIGRNLGLASQQVNALLGALQVTGARFQGTLTKMDQLVTELNVAAGGLKGTAEEFHGTGVELHAAAVENRERLGALMAGLQTSLKTLNATLEQTQSLVADPELRANLKLTADNVRAATENLKKLTADVQGLTGDPMVQSDLKESLSTLRKTTQEAYEAFQQVNHLLGSHGDTIDRFKESTSKTQVSLIGLADPRHARGLGIVDVTVPWSQTNFWRAGLFDAGESNGLNLQYGQKLGFGNWEAKDTWWRLGAHASHAGVGLDWGPDPARPKISADFYDLQYGRLDVLGGYRLSPSFDAMLGMYNIFRDPSPVVGLRWQYGGR